MMKETIRIKRNNLTNKVATNDTALKETAKKFAKKFAADLKLRFRLRQALSLCFIYALVFAPFVAFDAGVPKAQAQNFECVLDLPDRIFQRCPLGGELEAELENAALGDVLAFYNLPDNDSERARVRRYGRDEIRSFLYARVVALIKKENPPAREQNALNRFASVTIRGKRVGAAQAAQIEHQRWSQNACGYVPPAPFTYNAGFGCYNLPSSYFAGPTPPTFEEFQQFGVAVAYEDMLTPQAQKVAKNTTEQVIAGVGAVAVGIGAAGGAAIGVTLTFSTISAIVPFAAAAAAEVAGVTAGSLAGAASGAVGGVAVAGPAAVIIAGVLAAVLRGLQVQEQSELPGKLAEAVVEAQNQTIVLRDLLDTEIGNQELYGVFLTVTLPDFPGTEVPPPTASDRRFITTQENGSNPQEVSSFSYLGADGVCHTARLNGAWFVDRSDQTNAETLTLNIKFLDHIFLPKMASRKGAQFIITDVISGVNSQLTDSIPYRTCASGAASQKRFAKLKLDTMTFFSNETIPVGCSQLEPQNGINVSVGAVSATADQPQALTLRVNGQTTATVNGITVRNLSIDSGYRITANVLTDRPAPTAADFTFTVRNSLGQTVTRVITVKKTAIIDTMEKRTNHDAAVGANFDLTIDEPSLIINCAGYTLSVSGEIPPGMTIEGGSGFNSLRLSGTPTSGGRYTFIINRNYSNGEVLSRTFNIFVQSNLAELAPDLVSWWRGEKDAEDETGRSKGRMVGSVKFTRGKVNQGFSFNGTNGYVSLPSTTFNSSNDFTFDLWFKTNQKGVILGRQNNVEPYDTPQFGATPAIYVDQNGKLRVQMFLNQNNQFTTSPNRVDDNSFHHVAVTYHRDSRTRTVYLDGAAIGSITNSPQFASANDKYQFGTGYVNDGIVGGLTGWFNFKGVIDEPTLHSRVLTSAQIAEIFRSGGAGKMRVDVRAFPPLQHNGNTGAIHLRGVGGSPFLSYSINGGATFQDKGIFLNLAPGTYNIVVRDGSNRTMTRAVVVTNPPPNLSLTTSVISPRCNGAQTGEIRIHPTGATGAVEFSVLNGGNVQTSNTFTGLGGGTYRPWIRDLGSNTIYAADPFVLTQPAPITVSPSVFPNAQTGVAYSQTFTVGGGTAPYNASVGGTNFANGFALPSGLTATVSGNTVTISGTPSQGGTFPIRFAVTDNNTCFKSVNIPLTVIAAGSVSVGGKVSNGGQGLPNAIVTLSGASSATTTTNAAGNYIFYNLNPNQNYAVAVNLNGYTFAQPSIALNGVNANQSNADFTTAFVHYEGDIAGRPAGDGAVNIIDLLALRRIRANLDPLPASAGEWQRASVAPRSSLGSTLLRQQDENQLLNYIVGYDPLTLVGGPAVPTGFSPFGEESQEPNSLITPSSDVRSSDVSEIGTRAAVAPAQISAASVTAASGGAVTVPLTLTSDGNTTAVQFTVTYDADKLTLASVSTANQDNLVAAHTATPGKVSVAAYRVLGGMVGFPQNIELLRLNFTVVQGVSGTTPIAFTAVPTAPLAADAQLNPVVLNSSAGTVTVFAPTAATVSASGRVLTPQGRGLMNAAVTMTDANGNARSSRTGPSGYFRFEEVAAGQTYVFSVSSKRYNFAPQVVTINEDVSDLIFTAQ